MHPLVPRLALLSVATALVSHLVNSHVPEPYLDEVFHIPQAQSYCRNNFTYWDPKLTTPPGLYLLSYPLSLITPCTPALLRSLNALGVALILPLIVYRILLLLNPHKASDPAVQSAAAHTALNIALFPLLFFFAGLYYTDVFSTVFVLASYMFWLQNRVWSSAAASWLALWFRQTNILWTAFLLALEAARALELAQGPEDDSNTSPSTTKHPPTSPAKKRRKKGRPAQTQDEKDPAEEPQDGPWTIDVTSTPPPSDLHKAWTHLLTSARKIRIWNPVFSDDVGMQDIAFSTPVSLLLSALHHPLPLIAATTPYILVLASFAAFLVSNGGIVLGDKEAHTATLHIPQLYYFCTFTVLVSCPVLVSPAFVSRLTTAVFGNIRLPRRMRRRKTPRKPVVPGARGGDWTLVRTAVVVVLVAATVYANTVLHPYLLADNRHFVFYVFRRTILRHWAVRYVVVPVYVCAGWGVYEGLRRGGVVSVVWVVAWTVGVAGTLLGAGLVEGRYFVVGWVLWRVHLGGVEGWRRGVETLGFAGVDVAVLWVFLRWGFEWESERGKVQRFMW